MAVKLIGALKQVWDTGKKYEAEARKVADAYAEIDDLNYQMALVYKEYSDDLHKWSKFERIGLNRTIEELEKTSLIFAQDFDSKNYNPGEYKELVKKATKININMSALTGYSQAQTAVFLKRAMSGDEDILRNLDISLEEYKRILQIEGYQAAAEMILDKIEPEVRNGTRNRSTTYKMEEEIKKERKTRLWAGFEDIIPANSMYKLIFGELNSKAYKAELRGMAKSNEEKLENLPQEIENFKKMIQEFDRLKQEENSNPELTPRINQLYEEIIKKYPGISGKLENTSESSSFFVENLETISKLLKNTTEQHIKDDQFGIDLTNIKEDYLKGIHKIQESQEKNDKAFYDLFKIPVEELRENEKAILAIKNYKDMKKDSYEYKASDLEVSQAYQKIFEAIKETEAYRANYGLNQTKEFQDMLTNHFIGNTDLWENNKKASEQLELDMNKRYKEAEMKYENSSPIAEYNKYLKEEYAPGLLKNQEKNIKIISDQINGVFKDKQDFESKLKLNYDDVIKNSVIREKLENFKKNGGQENYRKLEDELYKIYNIKKSDSLYGIDPAEKLLTISSSIGRRQIEIEKAQKDMLIVSDQYKKNEYNQKMKVTQSPIIANANKLYTVDQKVVLGKTHSIREYTPQKNESDKALENLVNGFNNAQKNMGRNPETSTQKNLTQTVKVQRKVQQPQRTVTYREPTKWEVMSKELKKAVKDLESKAGKMGKVILDTSDKLAKLEIEKLHKFSDVMGMSESDVLFSEIGILEKQRQIALEVGKKEKVESLTAEIKEKKKKAENAKFYDDINGSYEQKTNQLSFNPSDKQYDDFKEKFTGYYDAKMENLTRLLVNGLITKNQFEQESLNLMGEKLQKLIDLKKYNEAMKLTLEKYQAEFTKIQEEAQKDIEDIKEKGLAFGSKKSEILQQQISVKEKERLDLYLKGKEGTRNVDASLENTNKQLEVAIKNKDYKEITRLNEEIEELKEEKNKLASKERIDEINVEISKLKEEHDTKLISEALSDGIRDIFKNINPKDFRGSLASSIDSIFEKQFNVLLDKDNPYNGYKSIIEEKMKEAFDGYKLTGNYVLDQSEYNKRFEEFLDSLIVTGKEGLVNLAGSMKMERVKTSLDDLASTLSRAGSVLKDDFLTNLSVTAESLSGLTSIFQNTNLSGPIGEKIGGLGNFLSPFTSVVGTVFGTVNAGVSLFRSFGIGSNKNKKHNEEEKRKANEWYANKSKENENLFSEINTLTNSIQNLTTKLIQNIASDTSDKNIAKQKNYYNMLIGKTGDLYEGQITATGHSSKKKGLFGGKKNSHATLSQGFDEYFGSVWKNTARDSGSLQSFYDTYLQNFDFNVLKGKLGKSKLDNNNIEEVKLSFLRFIEDVRVMEQYSANLPKNGILESFEGVEVADLFELRNEYQKQLEDIYKGMGKDPEKYRDEILSTVNSLIQNDQVIVSAFQDVKSRTIEQLSSGNDVILGLATGMESYFSKLESNFSKVFYDIQFQGFEEKFSNKFENLTNNLADFRLSGRRDFDNFLNENLNFWDLFTDLKNTQYIENDMKYIIDTLKNQAKASGLSDEIINTMFPDEKINEKTEKIKNALENSIRKALETNSFEQFSMSLGDSIYNNVKDSLVKAFYESQSFQTLADKYFLTEDYKNALDGAGSFKDAYNIIQQKLNEVELKLQSEGMDFRGTNATDGNYYGMTGKQEYKTSGILDNSKGLEFAVTLNNYGFMSNSEFMNTLKKEMKEFLYESGKEEV